MIGPEGLTLLIALWRKSMKMAWVDTFVMTNTELIFKSGLRNRESLNNRRNKLVQLGFIQYKAPPRGKSEGTYSIVFDLVSVFRNRVVREPVSHADNLTDNLPDNSLDRLTDNFSDNLTDNPIVSTKERKIDRKNDRENDSGPPENPWITFRSDFESLFGQMKKQHFEMANGYLDDGMEIEVLLLALEDAKKNKAEYPKYLWRTIGAWYAEGIKTMNDYRERMKVKSVVLQQRDQAARETAATSEGENTHGKDIGSSQRASKQPPGPSAESRRLDEIARAKGLIRDGEIRNDQYDF